ncbi:probable guanine nucleotide exchange factor MCF2L2 [Leptonychotes weddellii]|uniref:Probable guanine nucleotide exchange factor MCF2L2 n=1 Tax=Leptonychotes weddellii TaxID=9713 RepID=A0A7F8QCA7_LEPWE|nr:probable guanine nucleotide exchange factor MCF2L2 [Leptonychotes weddellii]
MERATSSKEDPVPSIHGIKDIYEGEDNGKQISPKCCSSREFISMATSEEPEVAEEMEKESSALSLSGLFQLDDSYETCSSKSVLETGESIQGKKEGGDEDL